MRLERAVPVLQVAHVGRSMLYGLVEFEVLDPDGDRICVSGAVRAGADVPMARECEEASR